MLVLHRPAEELLFHDSQKRPPSNVAERPAAVLFRMVANDREGVIKGAERHIRGTMMI